MNLQTVPPPATRRLPRAWRALLHVLLLQGLRPTRRPPPRNRWPDQQHGQALTPFVVHGARGQRLACWRAEPQGVSTEEPVPVVVAVHGWGSHAAMLSSLIAPLVGAGMAVVLFDAASHGDSSREAFSSLPRFAEDLAAVLEALRRFPALDTRRVGLLGHSLGGAAVLLHAARHGEVKCVASLSSFAHPQEVMERWLRAHRIPGRWIGAAILEHVQEVIGERFDHIAPERQMARIGCPVLVVHGAQDQTVPLSDALRLHEALPRDHGRLLIVEGDHDLRAPLVHRIDELVDFLGMHLGVRAAAALA